MRLLAAVLLGAAPLAACGHSEPFASEAPDALGPFSDPLPRRLTFNPGQDEAPSGIGGRVVYARLDPSGGAPGSCLATLPAEGGTLEAEHCPPAPTPADTFLITWLEPAIAPDGSQMAFLWQRGARGAIAAWSHHLAVAPTDQPRDTTLGLLLSDTLPDGRRFNTMVKPLWTSGGRVRFLAAIDSVVRLVGGGVGDTVRVPRAVMELDPTARTLTLVPGGENASAYTLAPDGTVWLTAAADPSLLYRIDPGADSAMVVERFAGAVTDLAWVDGKVAAALRFQRTIQWIDPSSGASGSVRTPGPVSRLTGVDGGRVVIEVEAGPGMPADLWLVEVR